MSLIKTTAPNANWYSITSSSDGRYLAATVHGGGIYVNSNYGSGTWTQTSSGNRYWTVITSSSTGQHLAAVVYNGGIWINSNYGSETWTQTSAENRGWESITSSSDGQYLAAVVYNGGIWTNSNFGSETWTQTSAENTTWGSITSSSTGQYLAAGVNGGGIYVNSNYGSETWSLTSLGTNSWQSITSSSSGKYVAAAGFGGGIWINSNFGSGTWTQTSEGTRNWRSITSDSTGQYLAAVVYGGRIYSNYGSGTWTQISAPNAIWHSITSSSDGQYLAAVVFGGGIYTTPPPQLNLYINMYGQYIDISNILQRGTSQVSTRFYAGRVDIGSFFNVYTSGTKAKNTNIFIGGVDIANSFAKGPYTFSFPSGLISMIDASNNRTVTTATTTLTDSVAGATWNSTDVSYNSTRNTLVFNGTTSRLRYSNGGSLTGWNDGTNYTILFFYYTTAVAPVGTLLTVNRSESTANNQLFMTENNYFDYKDTSPFLGIDFTYTIQSNTNPGWVMCSITRNSGVGTAYLNNITNGTNTTTNIVTVANSNFYIGFNRRDNNSYFTGEIFWSGIWNRALSPSEISYVYSYLIDIAPPIPTNYLTIDNMFYAFSVRRLIPSYKGPVFTLRRSSDNTTSDFYTDATQSYLTTGANNTGTSYATWIGANTAFVTKWYDQSGKENHALQTNTSNQPYISFETNNSVSKYTIYFNNTSIAKFLSLTTPQPTLTVFCQFYNSNENYGTILSANTDYGVRISRMTSGGDNGDWYNRGGQTKSLYNNGSNAASGGIPFYQLNSMACYITTYATHNPSSELLRMVRVGTDGYAANRGMDGYMTEIMGHNSAYISKAANITSDLTAFYTNRLF